VVSLTDDAPARAGDWRVVIVVSDEELVKAGIHLSLLSNIFDGLIGLLDRLHVAAAAALVYKAWPEIKGDVEELIADVVALAKKISDLS
jgi:hypothetical protein